jgi:CHAD domain-containing protein
VPPHSLRLHSKAAELLTSRTLRLFAELPAALSGRDEGLHQMRVACRRLRVALPVLAAKERGKGVRRCRAALRRLVRLVGPARDLDVTFSLFAEAALSGRRHQPQGSLLRRRLRDARRRAHARLVENLLDSDLATLRRRLRALAGRALPDSSLIRARLTRCLAEERARFVTGCRSLGHRLDVDALHALRRSVRRLRYLAELSEEVGGRAPGASAALKDLQDRLGRLRDNALLGRWLAGQAARARRQGVRDLARVAAGAAARLGGAVRRLHADFLDQRPLAVVSTDAAVSAPEGHRRLHASIGAPRGGPERDRAADRPPRAGSGVRRGRTGR